MKRIKYFFTTLFIFSILSTYSQNNAIKTGLLGATAGDFSLSFERATTEKQSIIFKIGYWNLSYGLLFDDQIITPDAYVLQEMKGGINTLMEYRFYSSKSEKLNGFYFAPYLRYVKNVALFEDEVNNMFFDVDTDISRIGGGVKTGNQWIINNSFVIDLFLGLGLDNYQVKRNYTEQTGSFSDYNSIVNNINDWIYDWNYLKERESHEATSNNLLSKLGFLFPGIELGVNIGFAF